jgi:hypothetical protein
MSDTLIVASSSLWQNGHYRAAASRRILSLKILGGRPKDK